VTILLGNGNGTFTQKADLSTGIFPPGLAVGNFGGTNGDLVVTNGLNTSSQATFFCERWERQLRPEKKARRCQEFLLGWQWRSMEPTLPFLTEPPPVRCPSSVPPMDRPLRKACPWAPIHLVSLR
jgi:hypothetical protein